MGKGGQHEKCILLLSRQFLEHLQTLEYADKPDYAMLLGIFERTMKKRGIRDMDPFDWEKSSADTPGGTTTPALVSRNPPTNPEPPAQPTVDNQENLEPDNRKVDPLRITEVEKKPKKVTENGEEVRDKV